MTFPIITGMPEHHFGVDSITRGEGAITARMQVEGWMLDTGGRTRPGVLGVLVDNVLGYAVIESAPPGDWAVTTEMSVDLVDPLPGAGAVLRGTAQLLDSDRSGGFAEGRVLDGSGRVVARIRQRGRFVGGLPAPGPGRDVRSEAPLPEPVVEVAPDGAASEVVVTEAVTNPLGNLHGGVSLWLAEEVGRRALQEANDALVTASIHLTYLRPAPRGARVRVVAVRRHAGRSLGLADVRIGLPDGRPCVEATVVGHAT